MINVEENTIAPHFQEFEGYKDPCLNQEEKKQENEIESEPNTNTPTTPNTNTNTNINAKRRGSKGDGKSTSISKLVSSFSNVFSKKTESANSPTTMKKEKKKLEDAKHEQDRRMAHFIAELQCEGRSDEEIQLHLFHLRDVAQFTRPRSNSNGSIGEFFRNMHQAFKDEFSLRRERDSATVSVSTMNPFSAAASANYIHDLGLSLGLGLTYENLVALESVPRGVKAVDKLPVVAYTGQELPSNQTSCAICMADFETEEELKWLHCSHYFHKECIDKWLSVGVTCPVCKGEVHTD